MAALRQCRSRNRDGSPCRGRALSDGYCFAHSPSLAAKRREVSAKGGRNKAKAVRLRNLIPPRLIPVFDLLETALGQVHEGKLEPRIATAMAALAGAMVRVLTSGELEERVRMLEGKSQPPVGE